MSTDERQRKTWRPPEGFMPVESRVEGVTVHAPVPPEKEGSELVSVGRCDRCGGEARFDASTGRLRCGHCDSQRDVAAVEVGRDAREQEFRVATLERAARGWGAERTQVHCESCGADIVVAARALHVACAFCGSERVVTRSAPQDALRPRYVLPFQIDTEHARAILEEWLGSGWLQPEGLCKLAGSTSVQGVYLPAWTFDSLVVARWRVEVGRTVSTGDTTTTVWTVHRGNHAVVMDDEVSIAVGDLSRLLLSRIAPFNLDGLVEYDPEILAGWQARVADVRIEEAWQEQRLAWRDKPREEAWKAIKENHSQLRRFMAVVDFTEESWRHVLVPVHVAAFKHRGKTHHVLINGRTAAIAGQRPVDWWKVARWVAAGLAPAAVLGALATWLPDPPQGLIESARFAVIVGVGFAAWLLHRAASEDDA
ncbi:MAG: hypothetical protein AAF533_03405 [Acidobacteriota bacterium]